MDPISKGSSPGESKSASTNGFPFDAPVKQAQNERASMISSAGERAASKSSLEPGLNAGGKAPEPYSPNCGSFGLKLGKMDYGLDGTNGGYNFGQGLASYQDYGDSYPRFYAEPYPSTHYGYSSSANTSQSQQMWGAQSTSYGYNYGYQSMNGSHYQYEQAYDPLNYQYNAGNSGTHWQAMQPKQTSYKPRAYVPRAGTGHYRHRFARPPTDFRRETAENRGRGWNPTGSAHFAVGQNWTQDNTKSWDFKGAEKFKQRPSGCQFCFCNGEASVFYANHILKKDGIVTCPVLRKHVCPKCGATGDNAHTKKYCPKNSEETQDSK